MRLPRVVVIGSGAMHCRIQNFDYECDPQKNPGSGSDPQEKTGPKYDKNPCFFKPYIIEKNCYEKLNIHTLS